jgi:hypothetical protein
MVALTRNYCLIIDWCPHRNWWRFSNCTVYLYVILKRQYAISSRQQKCLLPTAYSLLHTAYMKREKNLETMLVITVGMLVLYYFFRTKTWSNYLLITSLVMGLIGVFSDFLSEKVAWVWGKIAHIMGTFNSYVLLSIIFFVFPYASGFFIQIDP